MPALTKVEGGIKNKKGLLFFLVLFMAFKVGYTQDKSDSIFYLCNLPVKSGYVFKYFFNLNSIQDPANAIEIFSDENEAFSVTDGEMINVLWTDIHAFIFIKTGDKIYIYSNLVKLNIEIGSKVQKGQSLGLIAKDKLAEKYMLRFHILNDDISGWNYIQLYNFLAEKFACKKTV